VALAARSECAEAVSTAPQHEFSDARASRLRRAGRLLDSPPRWVATATAHSIARYFSSS
jgi:hypothetical protein